ncbi:hypothetical protein AKJ53_00935 [candidate division MSBL1 archaeon SCGC-AAA382F02]|uniref:Uncharacterized protein n=1 Tax=candidate division MSBL1 archaeon SCGC-AAA382F02 TaxID=1698282 RepID=A0A133VII3_9EURY|nr:hypothetical protein AKJ53_00935 [candidate division MSBL1 archaeon SCGC-AAA382F02]
MPGLLRCSINSPATITSKSRSTSKSSAFWQRMSKPFSLSSDTLSESLSIPTTSFATSFIW